MKTVIKRALIILPLLLAQFSYAQLSTLFQTNEERGDTFYNEFSYADAIEEYKVAIRKNPGQALFEKIADCYKKLNDPANASIWYEKAVNGDVTDPMVYLNYAEALSSLEKYDEAKIWYAKYKAVSGNDTRPEQKIKVIETLSDFRDRSGEISVQPVIFNSHTSDFSPEFYENNKIVFVSSRTGRQLQEDSLTSENSEYLDLYVCDSASRVKPFNKKINSKYHEGPFAFYDNDQKIIFTRNNFSNNSLGADKHGVTKLKLFTSFKDAKGEWTEPVEFKFNNSEYSVGHPAVSKDGKILIFSSDMPGGLGGTDLYISKWIDNDWSEPKNLGPKVNTPGNELFPFISEVHQLFYASDGQAGLGGLDLFGTNFLEDENAISANLGKPLNTSYDDFAFIVKGNAGYFSSNRGGNNRNDDNIYSFKSTVSLLSVDMTAPLTYKNNNEEVDSSNVSRTSTDSADTSEMPTPEINVVSQDNSGETVLDKNEDASTPEKVSVIYFDFEKAKLTAEAEAILNQVIKDLSLDKNTIVEVRAYADSRGSKSFNQQLSNNRLNATTRYLTSHGIEQKRISAQAKGEENLVNNCADGVICNEGEHQLNRRTEVTVKKRD